MPVIGKPPTWHFCQLCGHWANFGVTVGKAPFQSGKPFPENFLMLAYAGWRSGFSRAYAGIGWRRLWWHRLAYASGFAIARDLLVRQRDEPLPLVPLPAR